MTYEVVMPYHLHMPSYFLGTFTEYPKITTKEKGTVVNQDYRSSFIESRTDDVMKLRMT